MFNPGIFKPGTCRILVLLAVLIGTGSSFYKVFHRPSPALFQMPLIERKNGVVQKNVSLPPEILTHFVSSQQNISAHAASLVEMNDGRIRAFWYAGSHEGAQDVQIRSAVYDPANDSWSAERSIINREDTQHSLLRYVKKLGNPVALRAPNGEIWLFYVTVSLGGWAGSSITMATSSDSGRTWSGARRLITSPFINISTLVKGTPFLYDDGTVGLPVYHEFIGKYAELLRINSDGKVIDLQRLSTGDTTLQPILLIKNQRQALVLMRRTGSSPRRVIATTTDDAGQHWGEPSETVLANPDAAVTGVVMHDGRILVALNDIEQDRDVLSLVVSSDSGATWKTIYRLEGQRGQPADMTSYLQTTAELAKATDSGITDAAAYAKSAQRNQCSAQKCGFEFSYPYMIQARNGDIHIVYTWNRSFIKHVRFTQAWLNQHMHIDSDATLH
jgi:predicted neuraminidase